MRHDRVCIKIITVKCLQVKRRKNRLLLSSIDHQSALICKHNIGIRTCHKRIRIHIRIAPSGHNAFISNLLLLLRHADKRTHRIEKGSVCGRIDTGSRRYAQCQDAHTGCRHTEYREFLCLMLCTFLHAAPYLIRLLLIRSDLFYCMFHCQLQLLIHLLTHRYPPFSCVSFSQS